MHLSGDVYKDGDNSQGTAGVAEVDLGDTREPPIGAVFTDADVRLFGLRGQVCKLPKGVHFGLKVENPVPLLDTEGKTIGSARVTCDVDGNIMADGLVQYGCPERLSIETGIPHFFVPEMAQTFLYLLPADLEKFGIPITSELNTSPGSVVKPLPAPKRTTFIVVHITRLALSSDPRKDAPIDPVVALSEEESP
jgi:hypothetical protein